MGKRCWVLGLCLIALIVVAPGCGQPAPEVSTATPVPATDPPAATEAIPTEEPTGVPPRPTPTGVPPTEAPATEAPTATPELTDTTEADTPTAPPTEAPLEEGAVLLERRCTVCHTLDRVESSEKSREEWESTVARMVEYGAQLNDAERAALIDYVAATYGG